ncbi:hypothetical protein [Nonomuraea sp. NPDC050786]
MSTPHLHEGVPLARPAAAHGGPSYRTLQRWLTAWRRAGSTA